MRCYTERKLNEKPKASFDLWYYELAALIMIMKGYDIFIPIGLFFPVIGITRK